MCKSVIVGALFAVALSGCASEPVQGPLYPTGEPIGEDSRIAVAHAAVPQPSRVVLSNAPVSNAPPPGAPADPSQIPPPPETGYDDTDPSALQDFREPLAPYGTWVDDASYGTVWTPREDVVGEDFAPYVTGGHWTYDDQYTWVSDYAWGWAPFHYGRWVWMTQRGWGWIPGRQYSGGWVAWRTGPVGYGYVGWAPMPPSWYWYGGSAVGVTFDHPVPYVFCAAGEIFNPQIGGHIVTGAQVAQVGAGTRPYTPATPNASGARTTANPTVNGTSRTTANPSVNGPAAGSGITALSRLNAGPNPHDLGIANPPGRPIGDASLDHAIAFASPRTAAALGGHAPSTTPTTHFLSQVGGNVTADANLPPRLRATVSAPAYTQRGLPYNGSITIGHATPIGAERMPERLPSSAAAPYARGNNGSYGSAYQGRSSQSYSSNYSHPSVSSTPAVNSASGSHSSGYSSGSTSSGSHSSGSHSGGRGGGHR